MRPVRKCDRVFFAMTPSLLSRRTRPLKLATPVLAFALKAGLALTVLALVLGCAAPTGQPPAPDYEATVQLLLPTAEPTEPPTPTVAPTPTESSAPPPPPTYTPRPMPTDAPQPTYTPRPVPTQMGSGEREPSIPFQARLLDGTDLSLPDTAGTPTLLAFWAHW